MALAVVGAGGPDRSAEDRLAELMGLANTVAAEIVAVIAEALASGAWEGAGIRSPEHWVTWRCGVSPGRARRLVVAARRLGELPVTAAAFASGELTEDQVAVIAAHTEPVHDAEVAELARYAMVPQLSRALRSLPEVLERDLATPGPQRQVSFHYGDDGWWRLRAVLPADEGAVVQASLEAARAAEFADRHPDAEADAGHPGRGEVGWADGLARQAAAALDALEAGAQGASGGRVQVLVHVDADKAGAPAHLHLGPALPAVVRRHLGCDAALRAVIERGGVPVAVGRRRRTVDHRLRTLIEDRDRGCRVPGCAQTRWLHVHHLVHWEDGGATEPGNLLALCPAHHRAHHHGEIGIAGDPDKPDGLVFTNHWGGVLNRPPPPPPDRPPPEAARHLGLPPPNWQPPTGEQLHAHWLTWSEPPRAAS